MMTRTNRAIQIGLTWAVCCSALVVRGQETPSVFEASLEAPSAVGLIVFESLDGEPAEQIIVPQVPSSTLSGSSLDLSTPLSTDHWVSVQDDGSTAPPTLDGFSDRELDAAFGPPCDCPTESWPNACQPARLNYRDELLGLPAMLWDDARAVLQPRPMALLVGTGLLSLAVRETIDPDIAADIHENPNRWGDGTDVLGVLGGPGPQMASAFALYMWSIHTQDEDLHLFSSTLFSALAVSNTTNYFLKVAANGSTPNYESYGWPSGHAESTMCLAVVVHRHYGLRAALPWYALTGAVSYARIDDEEHFLSDVLFGVAIGWVVGNVVSENHLKGRMAPEMFLFTEPETRARGVAWQWRF